MDVELSSVLVVGASSVGKKTLIARITGRSEAEQSLPCSWSIDTKYYTAETSISAVRCSSSAPEDAGHAEALILAIDATDQQSFETAKAWHAQLATSDAEICLLVMNKMDQLTGPGGSMQRSQWHDDAQDWCCEHYFEYIEASAADAAVDQNLEDQGVRRVIGALHAHTWPGLQMKGQADANGASSSAGLRVEAAPGPSSAGPGASSQADGGRRAEHAAAEVSAASGGLPPAQQQQQQQPQQPNGHAGVEDARLPEGHQNGLHDSTLNDADDAGVEFERLMGSLSAMRGQLTGLPDNERRSRAAEMAMQMMSAFGLDEDDSDEEDESLP